MRTLIQSRHLWVFAVLFGLMTVPIVNSTYAQEKEGERLEIRIEDGKIWVNGKEVPEGADIKDYLPEGMKDVVVDIDDDGETVMVIERSDDEAHGKTINIRRLPRAGGFVFDSDDHVEWMGDDDTRARVWSMRRPDMLDEDNNVFLGVAPHLERLAEAGPTEFLFGFRDSSPEVARKERESRELAREARDASGNERAELESKLDELLNEIFDMKRELRQERVAELEQRLSKAREDVAERNRSRDEIIARRKAELLGQRDKYDW